MGRGLFNTSEKCIYCFKSGCTLTREHIVPYFLGGELVLQNASCNECSNITSAFETALSRESFAHWKHKHKLPSRKNKNYKEFLDGQNISYEDFPAPLFMPHATTIPNVLCGQIHDFEFSDMWKIVGLTDDAQLQKFYQKFPNYEYRYKHIFNEWSRLLAKIGYSYIVAEVGLYNFEQIGITDFIRGEKKTNSQFVGGLVDIPEPYIEKGHNLSWGVTGRSDYIFLISELRLFQNCKSPVYTVVGGKVQGQKRVREFLEVHKLVL